MKKHIEKFKVRIDQNLNRIEKSVALSPDLVKVEETIVVYKQVCSSLQKKISEDLQGYGKGTDGSSIDRRLKKTGDFVLGNIFSEVGRNLHKQNPNSCLGNVLTYLGELFPQLANSHVNYEICVEQMVISKLQDVLNTDLPKIKSSRANLDKLLLDLDTTKARLEKARDEEAGQHGANPAHAHKIDKLNEELDDILRNVDQARDGLAADMLSFLSRDNEIAALLSNYIDYRIQLLKENFDRLEESKPRIESLRSLRKGFPVFGTPLQDHIKDLGLESGIAFPIQLCCTKLIEIGLDEEGLFRLAAGASKVKRLRAEVEAGHAFLNSVDCYDHHVFTALIKTYLRELPTPLLGEELYEDWLEAGQLPPEDRFNAIWNLLQSDYLPRDNYKNIQYLFKFLHEVTQHSDKNKMGANNLAIVITPNVIWSNNTVQDVMDVGAGGVLQQVVELIITQYSWFFQNDPPVVYNQNLAPLKTCLPFGISEDQQRSLLGGLSDLPVQPQTLGREKSRKLKPKPSLPGASSSYSPNGTHTPLPNSPPASPATNYRQHSSPSTPRSSESFRMGSSCTGSITLQHPSQPPPKPPLSNPRASLELTTSSNSGVRTTPTRPRAMTDTRNMIDTSKTTLMDKSSTSLTSPSKTTLMDKSSSSLTSPLTSPERVVAQQTKDLINISSRLVISETSGKDDHHHRHNSPELPSSQLPKTDIHTDSAARQSGDVDTKKDPPPYPVPAPRSIKPALPTKPEGLVKTDTVSKLNGGGGGLYPNLDGVGMDAKDVTKL